MSSGEAESASLQRSKNISCRRAGAAFGLGALQGSEMVIFLMPWLGRGGILASGASLLENAALVSSTLCKRVSLPGMWVQGKNLVLSCEESPQSHVPVSKQAFSAL